MKEIHKRSNNDEMKLEKRRKQNRKERDTLRNIKTYCVEKERQQLQKKRMEANRLENTVESCSAY